jgi:hypothetical protein
MANQAMSTMMANSACDWVLARLPLWVGDCVDRAEQDGGEGGDLSNEDHQTIERHLAECPSCCRRRLALEEALRGLAAVTADSVGRRDAPSLWPALKRRIENRSTRTHARWLCAISRVADRRMWFWWGVDGGWPLRRAWVRDSLSETLAAARPGLGLARLGRWLGQEGSNRQRQNVVLPGIRPRLVWILGLSLTAAAMVWLVVLPAVRRQMGDAQSVIAANAEPLPDRLVSPAHPDEDSTASSEPADVADIPANELAQAELVRPAEAPAPGVDGGTPSKPVTPAPTRYGYDLDHGIPMPPDARNARPVY